MEPGSFQRGTPQEVRQAIAEPDKAGFRFVRFDALERSALVPVPTLTGRAAVRSAAKVQATPNRWNKNESSQLSTSEHCRREAEDQQLS
jgi:hypothetical protein